MKTTIIIDALDMILGMKVYVLNEDYSIREEVRMPYPDNDLAKYLKEINKSYKIEKVLLKGNYKLSTDLENYLLYNNVQFDYIK